MIVVGNHTNALFQICKAAAYSFTLSSHYTSGLTLRDSPWVRNGKGSDRGFHDGGGGGGGVDSSILEQDCLQ